MTTTGLIATDWGGTAIELWSSPDALAKCGVKERYDYVKRIVTISSIKMLFSLNLVYYYSQATVSGVGHSGLWNAMIYPFLNMTIKGAIWYQGEANAGKS